jgi:hypothetical protein
MVRSEVFPKACCGQTIICNRSTTRISPRHAAAMAMWLFPPEKIVPDFAPDGNAYLFMLTFYSPHDDAYDEQIVCFVRPNGGN